MANNVDKANLRIFNLTNSGYPLSVVSALYEKVTNKPAFCYGISNSDTLSSIDFEKMMIALNSYNSNYYSINCLYAFPLEAIKIPKLAKYFNSINELGELFYCVKALGANDSDIVILENVFNELGIPYIKDYVVFKCNKDRKLRSLYNLVDTGVSRRDVDILVRLLKENPDMKASEFVGHFGVEKCSVLRDIRRCKWNFMSINQLLYFGINWFVVEELCTLYSSLEELAKDIDKVKADSRFSHSYSKIEEVLCSMGLIGKENTKDEQSIEVIKLYNLVESGIYVHLVDRILFKNKKSIGDYISKKEVIDAVEGMPGGGQLLSLFETFDTSYYSLYALTYFGISIHTIDKLQVFFKNMNDIASNIGKLDDAPFQENLKDKIKDALITLKLCNTPIKKEMPEEIIFDSDDGRDVLKLYNLVVCGISLGTINRIIKQSGKRAGDTITKKDIVRALGSTPTSDNVVKKYDEMATAYYSLYSLAYYGISEYIIDKLLSNFSSMEDLSKNVDKLDDMQIAQSPKAAIRSALLSMGYADLNLIKKEVLDVIAANEPYPNNKLKELILNEHHNLSSADYDGLIDKLIEDEAIRLSSNGLSKSRISIEDYFKKANSFDDKLVFSYLQGKTMHAIADEFGISKQRISQRVSKSITSYPVFAGEQKYFNILNSYAISANDMIELGYEDSLLISYIKIKNKPHPQKSVLDFIKDTGLLYDECCKHIIENKGYAVVEGELVKATFVVLFRLYCSKKQIVQFDINDIKNDFNNFLVRNNVSQNECFINGEDDLPQKCRALANAKNILDAGGQKFYIYDQNKISFELKSAIEWYLYHFEGYGSVEYLFNQKKSLCFKHGITDENYLYAVIRKLFESRYTDIEFIRNPMIVQKGIDKYAYVDSLVKKIKTPCTVDEFVTFVYEKTGIKKQTFLANFSDLINEHKKAGDFTSESGDAYFDDATEEEKQYLRALLGESTCISTSRITNMIKDHYGNRAKNILNEYVLNDLGYTKTNTSIYLKKYKSRLAAVQDSIKGMGYSITETELTNIADRSYFFGKLYDFADTCFVVQIGSEKYLNLLKRGQNDLVRDMKYALENELKPNEYYTVGDFMQTQAYKRWVSYDSDFYELLNAFNANYIIRYLVITSKRINSMQRGKALVFSMKDVSLKVLIEKALNENGALSLIDLKEVLADEYGIEQYLSNTELAKMGFYCPQSSEKVYLTQEYYEKEMEEYLNGNSQPKKQ